MASIKRDAQTVDFGQAASSRGPRDTTSYVGVDIDAERGSAGRVSTASAVQSSSLDNFVGQLGQAMQIYGNRQMKFEGEKQYLAGAADAMAGKSKEQVETNIFTRAWKDEGFADTRGRLGIADSEAQLAADMVKLREQDPTKMKEYLTTRREGLLGLMEGMSMEARKSMMGQMALSDQHALVKHQGEYSKFVIDQQATAITTAHTVNNNAMNANKGDPNAYSTAVDNTLGGLYANVLSNPNLPVKNKQELLKQAALLSLSSNNEMLYERMRDVKDPQGRTMLEQLPFDDQVDLAKAYQASQRDTATMRLGSYNSQMGLYKARLDDPMAPGISWAEHQAFMAEGIRQGAITGEQQVSMSKQWADSQRQKTSAQGGAAAFTAGDRDGMFRLGVSEEEGANQFIKVAAAKGMSMGETVTSLIHIGSSTGQNIAYKKAGELIRSSVSAIGADGKMDPGALSGVNAVLKSVESQALTNPGAKVALMSAFDDATQAKLLTYMDGLKKHGNSELAAADAATKQAQSASMTPAERAARGNLHAKENAEIVNGLQPKGMFSQIWEKAVPNLFRSNENIAADKLRVKQSWFENPERVAEAQSVTQNAIREELSEISRNHEFLSGDARKTMALTAVANRTIVTDGGPVVIPRGHTVQSFFGVPPSVNGDIVSSALNELHPAGDGNRIVYSISSDNRLQWQEKNKDGLLVNPGGIVDPKSIAPAVKAQQDKVTMKFIQTDGAGTLAKGKDGAQVRYNGDNTIGIGTNVMFMFRQDLVEHEGVTNKPYPDGSGGRTSVGVGVNSGNPRHYPKVGPDGTVSFEDISRSFMTASDDAMKTANGYLQSFPADRRNVYASRLLGSMSYQGGSVDSSVLAAFKGNDPAAAVTALKGSRQYQAAPAKRRAYYETMLNGMFPRNNF